MLSLLEQERADGTATVRRREKLCRILLLRLKGPKGGKEVYEYSVGDLAQSVWIRHPKVLWATALATACQGPGGKSLSKA